MDDFCRLYSACAFPYNLPCFALPMQHQFGANWTAACCFWLWLSIALNKNIAKNKISGRRISINTSQHLLQVCHFHYFFPMGKVSGNVAKRQVLKIHPLAPAGAGRLVTTNHEGSFDLHTAEPVLARAKSLISLWDVNPKTRTPSISTEDKK